MPVSMEGIILLQKKKMDNAKESMPIIIDPAEKVMNSKRP
jgi:hypothetical protein